MAWSDERYLFPRQQAKRTMASSMPATPRATAVGTLIRKNDIFIGILQEAQGCVLYDRKSRNHQVTSTSNDGNIVNELGLEETVTSILELGLCIGLSTSLFLQTMVRICSQIYLEHCALRKTWPPTQQLSGVCPAVNMSGLVLAQSVLFSTPQQCNSVCTMSQVVVTPSKLGFS